MATKGYLTDIEFTELLRIISKHDGKLGIWHFETRRQFDFFFKERHLIHLLSNGSSITDGEQIQKIVTDLIPDRQSYYVFQKEPPPIRGLAPLISVKDLLSAVVKSSASVKYDEDILPNIHTRFEAVNKTFSVLSGELADFWENCFRMLSGGCSITHVATRLNLDIQEVRQNFHKLRLIGLIKPVRAFSADSISNRMSNLRNNLSKIQRNIVQTQVTTAIGESSSPFAVTNFSEASPSVLAGEQPTPVNRNSSNTSLNNTEDIIEIPPIPTTLRPTIAEIPKPVEEPPVPQVSKEQVTFTAADRLSAIMAPPPSAPILSPAPTKPLAMSSPTALTMPPPTLSVNATPTSDAQEKQGLLKRMLSSLFSRTDS